jgi:hypothetical protein
MSSIDDAVKKTSNDFGKVIVFILALVAGKLTFSLPTSESVDYNLSLLLSLLLSWSL